MTKTIEFDIGNLVLCDLCDKDYTFSDATGGFVFESKGVCPDCAPEFMKKIEKYHEQRFIRGVAGANEPYRDFILRMRGGNNKITISGGNDVEVDSLVQDYKDHFGVKE
jgi:hypothetical protein